MSVEETLAAAAQATAAAQEAKPKKERVKKDTAASTTAGLDGEQVTKKVRVPKEKKPAKQYPQANEDGTQKFDEATGEPVMGPRETQYKAPKAAKAPKAPRVGRVAILVDDEPTTLAAIQNDAKIVVHGSLGSKEGSKRAERAKAFEGATTVQDFLAAGGVSKDLLRHLKTGAITLDLEGKVVSVAEVAKAEPAAETAE